MKVYALVLLLGLVGGYFVRYATYNPSEVVKVQEKVVTQDVIKTITKIVKQPGGVTVITKESTQVSEKKADKVTSHVSSPAKAAASYRGTALFTPTFEPYALGVERRVLGPVWAGVQANKDREILFTLSWEL